MIFISNSCNEDLDKYPAEKDSGMNMYAAVFVFTEIQEDACQQRYGDGQMYYEPYWYDNTG